MNLHDKKWKLLGEKVKGLFKYIGCGLNDVYLVSGYDKEETIYGCAVRIRDIEKLHEAIGKFLINEKRELSGKELRFLRLQMNLTQSKLARIMGCNARQVARYENEKNDVPGAADRLIRLLYKDKIDSKRIPIEKPLSDLDKLDEQLPHKTVFSLVDGNWQKAGSKLARHN